MKELTNRIKQIVEQDVKTSSDMTDYFERHSTGPKLERLEKPCDSCAVTTGLYQPYAEELSKQAPDLQERALDTWYCHDHCHRACRGAYNYVQMKNRKDNT